MKNGSKSWFYHSNGSGKSKYFWKEYEMFFVSFGTIKSFRNHNVRKTIWKESLQQVTLLLVIFYLSGSYDVFYTCFNSDFCAFWRLVIVRKYAFLSKKLLINAKKIVKIHYVIFKLHYGSIFKKVYHNSKYALFNS